DDRDVHLPAGLQIRLDGARGHDGDCAARDHHDSFDCPAAPLPQGSPVLAGRGCAMAQARAISGRVGPPHRNAVIKDAVTYLLLIIASLIAAGPVVYLLATSFKQTYSRMVDFSVFRHPTLINYHNAWFVHPFRRWTINSLIVATVVTVLIIFLDSLAGYAFARKKFRGRD